MKRTSHTTKTHKRRKPIPGLTPDALVKQMQQEAASAPQRKEVRELRRSPVRPDREVLSDSREGVLDKAGSSGIFGTVGGDQPASVPDTGGATQSPNSQLSRILKRMLGEAPPAALMDDPAIGRAATNAELIGAVVMREAHAGKQWAIEMVRDQTEGKPVRAAQVNNSEGEIEDQLDRVSAAALNRLAKKGT